MTKTLPKPVKKRVRTHKPETIKAQPKVNKPCREGDGNLRANGSSRCQICTDNYRAKV